MFTQELPDFEWPPFCICNYDHYLHGDISTERQMFEELPSVPWSVCTWSQPHSGPASYWGLTRSHLELPDQLQGTEPKLENIMQLILRQRLDLSSFCSYSGDLNTLVREYYNGWKLILSNGSSSKQMPFEYRTKFNSVFRPPFEYQTIKSLLSSASESSSEVANLTWRKNPPPKFSNFIPQE